MNGPELKDIHLPDVSLWWPPAIGWWLLLLFVLLLLLLLPWLWRRLHQASPRKVALDELRHLRAEFEQGLAERAAIAALATLLRRTLLSYRGREGYAASTGTGWVEQLNSVATTAQFDERQLQLLTRDRYRRDCVYDIDELFRACERWLKSLPRSTGHAAA